MAWHAEAHHLRSLHGSPDQLNQPAPTLADHRSEPVYRRRWGRPFARADNPAMRAPETNAAESERDLTTLLEIARNLAATLELEPLLDLILDQVRGAVAVPTEPHRWAG